MAMEKTKLYSGSLQLTLLLYSSFIPDRDHVVQCCLVNVKYPLADRGLIMSFK